MAEPMDLSDEGIAALAPELVARVKLDGRQLVSVRADGEKRVVHTIDAARFLTIWLQDIRDAATAAERQRCIAIVERQPYYPDTHTGMRQQWVKDQILAALRGGDHD